MKKKDIIVLVISVIVIALSAYFLFRMIVPKKATTDTTQTVVQEDSFSGEIDDELLQKVRSYTDYGEATLDNIGRANPFAPLN